MNVNALLETWTLRGVMGQDTGIPLLLGSVHNAVKIRKTKAFGGGVELETKFVLVTKNQFLMYSES